VGIVAIIFAVMPAPRESVPVAVAEPQVA
jgi:hypothetical protein